MTGRDRLADLPRTGLDRRGFVKLATAAGLGGALLPHGVGLTRAQAQDQMGPLGIDLDPEPVPLGVASGDPTADGVVLQTRLSDAPFDLARPWGSMPETVEVRWVVAEDPRLRRVVASGSVASEEVAGHSVHVDVTGLEPGRHYWYRFSALGRASRIGRTKTAPVAPTPRLRVAYVSCQSFPHGYFSAYRNLCREDVDVVFHLGDYMYEYAEGEYGSLRASPPVEEVFSLNSYRVRYAAYRADPWLRQAHAMFPFVTTWDDHEVDNNWAGSSPENTTDEGNVDAAAFAARRYNAFQAYHENQPIRPAPTANDPADPRYQIYRQLSFGDLLDVSVLDTRQYRTDQPCDDGFVLVSCAGQSDPDATIMGAAQRDWLFGNLSSSDAAWRMIAQQLIVSQVRTTGLLSLPGLGNLELPPGLDLPDQAPAGTNVYFSADQWDGYLVERQALLDHLGEEGIPDTFVITGDIHSHWVNDVRRDFDDLTSPIVATEFVGTSVTSPGFEQFPAPAPDLITQGLYTQNPHIRFLEGTRKGYALLDLTPDRLRTTFRVVDSIETATAGASTLAVFELPRGGVVEQVEGAGGSPIPRL